MDDIKAKQQIIEKINDSTNILVTVSDNPTVDALSAAIGLTLLLDKLDKHATAVFSGVVPPAIAFLEPEKILDDTTDSLRDFIIALDKSKADHLRYKLEGDAVKIFITPYKTSITSDDLEFSQGDYNVEMIIALGVDEQAHLDKALENHGQILHDATVVTVTAGDQTSSLGGIDWHDDQASSLSEMITGIGEALKSDKKKALIDAQIATAFLTGIVAQTERFSNRNTTSKVMTVASKLMAAGADQQLIATKLATYQVDELDDEPTPQEDEPEATVTDDGTLKINNSEPEESPKETPQPIPAVGTTSSTLPISHPNFETLEEMDKRVKAEEQAEAAVAAKAALAETEQAPATAEPAAVTPPAPAEPLPQPTVLPPGISNVSGQDQEAAEPVLGGTLNATTEEAAEIARQQAENDQNHTILTHSYIEPTATEQGTAEPASPGVDAAQGGAAYVLEPQGVRNIVPPSQPSTPVNPLTPVDLGLPMPPPLPDFGAPAPVLTGPYAPEPTGQPERLGDILAPDTAPVPPVSPFGSSAPQPPVQLEGPYAPEQPLPPAPAPAPGDPGQFKIPGQS